MGVFGFDVISSLKRKGFRVKYRAEKRKSLSEPLKITKGEAEEFLKTKFGIKFN